MREVWLEGREVFGKVLRGAQTQPQRRSAPRTSRRWFPAPAFSCTGFQPMACSLQVPVWFAAQDWCGFKAIKLFPSCHSLKITQGTAKFYISIYARDLPSIVGRKASKHITAPRRHSEGYRPSAAVHVLALIIPSILNTTG